VITCIVACGPAPVPFQAEAPAPTPTVAPATPPREPEPVDALIADRYPSLAHYPGLNAALQAALARRDPPREIFAALADSLAPYRWPSALDWDRQGFIDPHGPRPGFVTRIAGALIEQTSDRHDLGCAGGFLEGVRLTLLPQLAVDDLDRCAYDLAVDGAPTGCDPEHAYGLLALTNVAARLQSEQLPEGPRLFEIGPEDQIGFDRLAAPDAMHLCTVSHASSTRNNDRYHHHLMIVLGTAEHDGYEVFDTTGTRGVALTPMSRSRFFRYCTSLLAANRVYRYVARSARLTCLPVHSQSAAHHGASAPSASTTSPASNERSGS